MKRNLIFSSLLFLLVLAATGCKQKAAPAAAAGMQALPVQTVAVSMSPVPDGSDYTATIKSRRSATLQPQVNGRLTGISVRSGELVKAGQVLMEIDPQYQMASVRSATATERQKKALYDYNTIQIERQRKLYEAGVVSRDAYDQAQQSYGNTKADYEAATETRKTQEEQLAYFTIRAPFDGVLGDIPVHVGDYVAPNTVLTTVDERRDLEAYIYIPTERSDQVRMGLPVNLTDNAGNLLEKTKINFVSPEVDSGLQGILAKAPVLDPEDLRHAQIVRARVIWDTKPRAVVPVLAVTRLGGQTFVYVAEDQGGKYFAKQRPITVGDTVGNDYAVQSGLKEGDKVIVSGTQFLMDGAPVMPLPPGPPAAGQAGPSSGGI
ncbi:MAG TPA: efflux RND transporter periplasmic adaptor subunit [Terracidiphilus sp.]|nr:efflux RND transporter periplasmic adaptor subunit [Terracidiphilus sp.]